MIQPIAIDGLAAALGLGDHELVSLVGGGGKTTALFALGHQLGGRTVLTTTTKMGRERTGGRHLLFSPTDPELDAALDDRGTVLVWRAERGHQATGVDPATCERWFSRVDHVVVEADGSRRQPFKAPEAHEPVVPPSTTSLIACIGVKAFGRAIEDGCHRPERVAAVAGCRVGDTLTPARAGAVITSEEGSRKGCPTGARFAVLVNRVESRHLDAVEALAAEIDPVPLVAVAPFEPDLSPELP